LCLAFGVPQPKLPAWPSNSSPQTRFLPLLQPKTHSDSPATPGLLLLSFAAEADELVGESIRVDGNQPAAFGPVVVHNLPVETRPGQIARRPPITGSRKNVMAGPAHPSRQPTKLSVAPLGETRRSPTGPRGPAALSSFVCRADQVDPVRELVGSRTISCDHAMLCLGNHASSFHFPIGIGQRARFVIGEMEQPQARVAFRPVSPICLSLTARFNGLTANIPEYICALKQSVHKLAGRLSKDVDGRAWHDLIPKDQPTRSLGTGEGRMAGIWRHGP